jgi:tripartite ATP-independent transporter DctP family solute receptor
MMLHKRKFLAVVLAVASTLVVSAQAPAQTASAAKPKFVFKIGHDQPESHPYHTYATVFAKLVNDKTNGEVKIDVYPGAQLGSEPSMTDSLRIGTLDFQITTTGNSSALLPRIGIVGMPFIYQSQDHVLKVVNDPKILAYYQDIVKKTDVGIELLTFAASGPRHIYSTQPVKSLADLKGLKIRTQPSPIEVKVFTALGAVPTTMPFSEIYTALQTKLITAAENCPTSYVLSKHNESAGYYARTEHTWMVHPILASSKTLAKLDEKSIQAIRAAAKEAAQPFFDKQLVSDTQYLQDAIKRGVVYTDKVDRKPFIDIVKPIQDQVAKDLNTVEGLAMIRADGA